jgi:hypothetical protein
MKEEIKEEFFNKLVEILEEQFPKGEKCQCGEKLPCRSKALVLNAYSNLYFKEEKERIKKLIIEEIVICHKEGTPSSRLTSLYNKII